MILTHLVVVENQKMNLKSEKVNNTNASLDKVKEGVKSTGIPTDLPSGSFGISPEEHNKSLCT